MIQVQEARRRYPIGAELIRGGEAVDFRVYAPHRDKLELVIEGRDAIEMQKDATGYFELRTSQAGAGSHYQFKAGEKLLPDPASRFQPEGPHGPSQVVDPYSYEWNDADWLGVPEKGKVVYEMHIGSFSSEGSWQSAVRQLPDLAELGVSVLEIMPVADFPGQFGWGYDGVCLFAPSRLYGGPDDFRFFVDSAHRLGMGVILDIVYNHIGPDGNYLPEFYSDFFHSSKSTEWGQAINFDAEGSEAVREFFISNFTYWLDEYHLDGYRLDATQDIHDRSQNHILAELVESARDLSKKNFWVVVENEPQNTQIIREPSQGGYGVDAAWNDDFHHAALVAMTGRKEAYYSDYDGKAYELLAAIRFSYLYQGQYYSWHNKPRGSSSRGLSFEKFVHYIQNHDQVANSLLGQRIHELTSPARLRAFTALLLLGPQTPLLFQGQEFNSSSPFLFFADHKGELGRAVTEGRKGFLSQFPSFANDFAKDFIKNPTSEEAFLESKLKWEERKKHASILRLYRDLLQLRKTDPVFREEGEHGIDGEMLTAESFVLRYFSPSDEDRLLIFNLGPSYHVSSAPAPLLAPPADKKWELIWSSESPVYGGQSWPSIDMEGPWGGPAESCIVFAAKTRHEAYSR